MQEQVMGNHADLLRNMSFGAMTLDRRRGSEMQTNKRNERTPFCDASGKCMGNVRLPQLMRTRCFPTKLVW